MKSAIVKIDLHGKNVYQSKIALDSAIKRAGSSVYRLHVIHGSNRGTAIRDMIWDTYPSHPKIIRLMPCGDGATDFILREM